MPEVLLRQQVANSLSVKELKSMFNEVCKKVAYDKDNQDGFKISTFKMFPELFLEPKAHWIASFTELVVKKIVETD